MAMPTATIFPTTISVTAYLNVTRCADADRAFESVRASGAIAPRDREYAQFDASAKTAKTSAQLAQASSAPTTSGSVASSAPSTAPSAATQATNAIPSRRPSRHYVQSDRGCFVASALVRSRAADGRDGYPATISPPRLAPPSLAGPARSGTPTAPRDTVADANSVRPPWSKTGAPRVTGLISATKEQAAIADYPSVQYEQSAKRLAHGAGSSLSPRASFYLVCCV
jgi:hypothetical protein